MIESAQTESQPHVATLAPVLPSYGCSEKVCFSGPPFPHLENGEEHHRAGFLGGPHELNYTETVQPTAPRPVQNASVNHSYLRVCGGGGGGADGLCILEERDNMLFLCVFLCLTFCLKCRRCPTNARCIIQVATPSRPKHWSVLGILLVLDLQLSRESKPRWLMS